MIGKLSGIIDEINEDHIIIDVHGVGYTVFCSTHTLGKLSDRGQTITLFIKTYMREDVIRLFGFSTKLEREWFCLLQNVQGIGTKVALAILGTLTLSELSHAIALRDIALVSRAPGVGKKVAERMITELKNKVPLLVDERMDTLGARKEIDDMTSSASSDAISALTRLGYSRDQVVRTVGNILKEMGEEQDSAKIIRMGLKKLAQ